MRNLFVPGKISHQFENWFEMTENGRYSLQGRCTDRPPPDLHRAGGVVKQAAAGSAEGGAVKQSEAILDGVFLSSQEDADAALGPVSFLCLARKILERKNRFPCLKGF